MRGILDVQRSPQLGTTLIFLPGTLTRLVIEGYRELKVRHHDVLGSASPSSRSELEQFPIYITGDEFGAISLEAKMAGWPKGASMAARHLLLGEGE